MSAPTPLRCIAVGEGLPCCTRWLFVASLCWALLGGPARGVAQPGPLAAPPAAAPAAITSLDQFWESRHSRPNERQTIDVELVATYYDPVWNLLWTSQGDLRFFVPIAAGPPLPLRSGQRVRITGTVLPAAGFFTPDLTVTVLEENGWPVPKETAGALAQLDRFDADYVRVEGYVVDQRELDASHVLYSILSDGLLVNARLLVASDAAIPQLEGARVRVRGTYVGAKDPSGVLQRIDLWIARSADIDALGDLASDPRFDLPRTLIGAVGQSAEGDWVHLSGEVVHREAGKSLVVRDETGQIALRTPQPGPFAPGTRVEVIGQRRGSGLETTLHAPIVRPQFAPTPAPPLRGTMRKLRLAAQVLELTPDEVALAMPVELSGVVTWAHAAAPFFYLQDASGGVCVWRAPDTRVPGVGETVAVRGTTRRGAFTPGVEVSDWQTGFRLSLPPARTVTLEQALTGAEDGRLVEIRGYLRRIVPIDPWLRLEVTTATGEFYAFAPPHPDFARLEGAIVRVAGVCAAESDARHELIGVRLWVTDPQSVTVEEPPAADPFAAPLRPLEQLRQYSGRDLIGRRVRTVGTVTRHLPGRALFVQSGDAGLLVLSHKPQPAEPGDRIELVGFPGREGSRLVLRAASWRRLAPGGTAPVPLDLDPASSPQPELDARLVRVRGTITEVAQRADETRLILRESGRFFEAQVPGTAPVPAARIGGFVELTGIYSVQFDEARRPRRFTVLMRSPDDVVLLAAPPWWTASRAVIVAGLLVFLSVVAVSWVVALRRRVARQTEQIRAQMEKAVQLQAELERSSRLESLGVLAGGIAHDFNNLLTAIVGHLGLISLEAEAMKLVGRNVGEAQRAAKRASDVTQQLLTFAKGGDPVRQAVSLAEVIREATAFALHGSSVASEFDFPPGLPAADVDPGQISRVVHNLVINAVQAMPRGGEVALALAAVEVALGAVGGLADGTYIRLKVGDNGPGIAPENLARIFEPYFSTKGRNSGLGLAMVHSIVKKHGGHVAVESELGRGTTFTLWLPVAPGAPAPVAVAEPPAPRQSRLRVLVMDDEEIIRNLVRSFLARAGHEAKFAPDGAEAVRLYADAKARGEPFDVVILDLTVPGGMGGREALAELMKIDPQVCAVASSGYSSDPIMANHRAHGFRAVMPKPYSLQTFAAVLRQVCG